MRTPHDIDNHPEEPFFQFDPYDDQAISSSTTIDIRPIPAVALPKPMPSIDRSLVSAESENAMPNDGAGKGKERTATMPMPIRTSAAIYDLFDISPPGVNLTSGSSDFRSSSINFSPISSGSSSGFGRGFRHYSLSIDSMEGMESPDSDAFSVLESPAAKGKERESLPVLPPLTFSMMQLDYAQSISPVAGPSSYGALFGPSLTAVNLPSPRPTANRENSTDYLPRFPPSSSISSTDQLVSYSHAPRSWSPSILSQDFSPSLDNVSTALTSPISSGSSHSPSNISRQLLDRKDSNDLHALDSIDNSSGPSATRPDLISINTDSRNYSPAWYTVAKPLALSPKVAVHTATSAHAIGTLKGNARSKSSPYPISALDYVPVASSDIFQPIPIVVINYFDLILPKELRLRILSALVEVHEQDLVRSIADGRLTMARATSSKGRWVGKDKGIRELFKFSRVSKAWQALVFDGELWVNLDFHSFPGLPPSILIRLVKAAGTFVKSLNFAGHIQLLPDTMSDITNSLCLAVPDTPLSFTQLTSVNFQGCTYLTTRVIHHLLVRSKSLQSLSLKGLATATNTTCEIIAGFLPTLTSLNLSRCPNVDGDGIFALTAPAVARKEHMPMKELRLSGLKYISDSMMKVLGRAMPYLEVLDLSYARHLHNSALEAFVACDHLKDDTNALQTVVVSARDLGRDANESGKFRRRVTKLRHLVLSSCYLLSDMACSNLAHSVPDLEFLELAGIGADLRDEGLVRLLLTTPNIRRLDLEDAVEITDNLISELTPVPPSTSATGARASSESPKQPGHALEYLNISYAANISEDALIYLIQNCPRLTVLEADNTRISADVLREFVKLSRERRIANAKVVAVDCRAISENVVRELALQTRPRLGWRAYDARKLMYLDARDGNEEDLKIGQDECDEARVVLKTFYGWQTVNAVQAAKEKRRKLMSRGRRTASDSSADVGDELEAPVLGRSRWWSPNGRRAAAAGAARGRNSPPILPGLDNDGCRAM